jgi:hypothetical protein
MTPQTNWEVLDFKELQELAADDDVIVSNESELISYLKSRSYDISFELTADGNYNILFA